MLLYARHTTLAAVEGLSVAELDYLQDGSSKRVTTIMRRENMNECGFPGLL